MSDDGRASRWHKDSRFWRIGALALVLSWGLVPLVLFGGAVAAVEEAIGAFSLTVFALLGGGAVHNFQQARAEVARAKAEGGAG